ncbi:2539_t:CDS:2 [Diversispora eburnea]|uniref:2539_t:CDS:1 n=1 Tax=Diversispora eburnea TaxID=1213867 RepID=A0A9N8ZRG7_9GLOM|nr:2539_t:CDS:2 [Diversispora eburnea]
MSSIFQADIIEDYKQLYESEEEGTEIVKILNAADELGLIKLIEFIQEYLIMNKIKILRQNPAIICPISHQECDNEGPNIVVAKIKDSQRLIGGYNPLDWNGNGPKSTNDSFIFSIDKLNDMTIASIARMKGSQSIYCSNLCGPIFGSSTDGDLTCKDNNNWTAKNSSMYYGLDFPGLFIVDDWEVFKVVKNV